MKKDENKVIISFDKVPIKKAFRRAKKSFLLVLVVLGIATGIFYTKFTRTALTEPIQIENIQNH